MVKDGALTPLRPPCPTTTTTTTPPRKKKLSPEQGFKVLSVLKNGWAWVFFVEVVFLNTVSLRQKKALFLITDHVWQETRLQFNCIIYRIITVHMTGLVIPSANNIVKIFFTLNFKQTIQRHIFSNKILPLLKLMRVYIVGIIF